MAQTRIGRRPRFAAGRHQQPVSWPKDLHRRIVASAEEAGLSFTDYLIERMAEVEGYQPELATFDDPGQEQLAIGA